MKLILVCTHCGGQDFYDQDYSTFCSSCKCAVSKNIVQHTESGAPTRGCYATSDAILHAPHKNRLCSFEVYNKIMFGLVNELINLGAKPSLREIIKCLWLKYLIKLKVFNPEKPLEPPKLQAVNNIKDSQTILGRNIKRRALSPPTGRAEKVYVSSQARGRANSTRNMTQPRNHDSDDSVIAYASSSEESFNEDSDCVRHLETEAVFNDLAIPIFLENQSPNHLQKHQRPGAEFALSCHRQTYDDVAHSKNGVPYIRGPGLLSQNKLYIILYIGLMLNGDSITLGQLLGWLDNHKLSFNTFGHFLPQGYLSKNLNIKQNVKHDRLSAEHFLEHGGKMTRFLELNSALFQPPSYRELLTRFINELNLPSDFINICLSLTNELKMKLGFEGNFIPNYEGRLLSIILIVLKLFFGLDGKAEYDLSQYTDILNRTTTLANRMFNLNNWIIYLEIRNIIVTEWHAPTALRNNRTSLRQRQQHATLLTQKIPSFCDEDTNITVPIKHLLNRLRKSTSLAEMAAPNFVEFSGSYCDFMKNVAMVDEDIDCEIVNKDFRNLLIDHVVCCETFVKMLNVEKSGTMTYDNLTLSPFGNIRYTEQKCARNDRQGKRVKVQDLPLVTTTREPSNYKVSAFPGTSYTMPQEAYEPELSNYLFGGCSSLTNDELKQVKQELLQLRGTYELTFPEWNYWVYSRMHPEKASHMQLNDLLENLPRNFRIVLRECSRLANQTEYELLREFIHTEFYIVFGCTDNNSRLEDTECQILENFIKSYAKVW